MAVIKEQKLLNGGLIKYRLPNVIEQLQFLNKSGWYETNDKGERIEVHLRLARAIEAGREFIVAIEGEITSIDEIMDNRNNTHALSLMAQDLVGLNLDEDEKKT